MTTTTHPIEIRRASDRGRTNIGWLDSAHSFSFGQHYDPKRMGYRSLRVINDDHIAPGSGFGEHGHDNMEIISWALDGALRHGDSLENSQVLQPRACPAQARYGLPAASDDRPVPGSAFRQLSPSRHAAVRCR